MNRKQELLEKIARRELALGVVGMGYVGLPLAAAFAGAGFCTVGIDADGDKVATLQAGQSYIADVSEAEVSALVRAGKLRATTDFSVLRDCSAVSICVPTPLSKRNSREALPPSAS